METASPLGPPGRFPSQASEDGNDGADAAAYVFLPSSSEDFGDELDRNVSPEMLVASLTRAVDAAADDQARLESIPNTTRGYYQFEFGGRESFNSSVRDLVQQMPDKPIGGRPAVPVTSMPASTSSMANRSGYAKVPTIEVYAPSGYVKDYFSADRLSPGANAEFCDPFRDTQEREFEEFSSTVITMPGTPIHDRIMNHSELSHDGPGESPMVKDFAATSLRLPDCCLSPRSTTGNETYDSLSENFGRTSQRRISTGSLSIRSLPEDISRVMAPEDRAPVDILVSTGLPKGSNGLVTSMSTILSTSSHGLMASMPSAPQTDSIYPMKSMPTAPPIADLISSAIPVDENGLLTAPLSTAPKRSAKAKAKACVQKGYKKARRIVMREHVLKVLVGRQYARPVREIIRRASNPMTDAIGSVISNPPLPIPVSVPLYQQMMSEGLGRRLENIE